MPLLAEDSLNKLQSLASIGDTSTSIRPSLTDLSISHAEESPNKVSSKQKQVVFESFSSEGL